MSEIDERVLACFRAVFPSWSDDQIDTAVLGEIDEWDSLATLTLITVLEEEFDVVLDDAAIDGLDSLVAVVAAMRAITA